MKLYSGTRNASSWAMRAWLALKEAGIEFEEEIVDIRRPQRFPNLDEIARFSPAASVPVLVTAATTIFDSLAIMEFANDSAGGTLLPHDPERRAQARSIVAWQHAGLSRICSRISFESAFYPLKRGLTEQERTECDRLFAYLDAVLEDSVGRFLFDDVSLADFALTPTVVRLLAHGPDMSPWRRVHAWSLEVLDHPHVRTWLDQAKALPHIWFDDYLLPDRPIALRPAGEFVPVPA